ncbi:MAG: lipoate--protein ligase [Bacteroidia bacterium]|nr:lipoate--protein ligase [Bacteroidia bacterium]
MIFVINPYTNPYFNLAAEEFLLNQFSQGFVMLWQNDNTVVVGKHQNALAEIDLRYINKNNIKLTRRISGGGTVFHDKGNLNFSIALPLKNESKIIDFRRFIDPVIEYLNSIHINAEASGRNDIIVGNLKISGNAEHHFRKEKLILHHGTLLFDSDLENLGNAIRNLHNKYSDLAVQSIRSSVGNIRPMLNQDMSLESFANGLSKHLINHFGITQIRDFTCDETDQIEALAVTKFEKDEWNYGYSPAYIFNSDFEYEHKQGKIYMEIERESIIKKIKIEHPKRILFDQIETLLVGQKHFPNRVDHIIKHLTHNHSHEMANLTYSFF